MPTDFRSLNAEFALKSRTNSSAVEELRNPLLFARLNTPH